MVKAAWSRKKGRYLYISNNEILDMRLNGFKGFKQKIKNIITLQNKWDNSLNFTIHAVINKLKKMHENVNTFDISVPQWALNIIHAKYPVTNISFVNKVFIVGKQDNKLLHECVGEIELIDCPPTSYKQWVTK